MMARNTLHKLISVVLCISFIISLSSSFVVFAEESKGKINADYVKVRTNSGTNFAVLQYNNADVKLNSGHEVKVLKKVTSTTDVNYKEWYQVKFTYNGKELSGYVYEKYVTIEKPLVEQEYTMPEGVPEEYKSYIENILKYYPNWKFVFYDTGLEWNSLFGTDQQGYVGRSLISYLRPLSYRSTASGCYNWRTDTWIALDSNQWYQANTETIAYYMDPRNFLNIDSVFMFESLSYDKATQTIDGVKKILEGSFMDGVKIKDTDGNEITYAEAYIKAAEITGVSPYHLASRTIQEVGKGGSRSVQGKGAQVDDKGTIMYEGYYNFYNIGATQGKYPIANDLKYASGATSSEANKKKYMLPWDSQYKAIVGGAIWIGNGYINSVYKQNTMYFQKFNTSGGNAGHQYMGNIEAPKSEAASIKRTYNELGILDKSFTFIIPCYKNMPKTACQLPASNNLNPNNWLSALYVYKNSNEKDDLIHGFDGGTFNWDLGSVNASNITIKATTVNSKAKVAGLGKFTLKKGVNTFNIVVTAENGNKQTYTVTVNAPNGSTEVTPPTTTQPPAPTVKLGDVDSDGNITITDALLVFKHKSGEKSLSADAQKAADTNKNGSVDIADALLIFKYKSGEISSF